MPAPNARCMHDRFRTRRPFPDECRPANRGFALAGHAASARRRCRLGLPPKPPACYRTCTA
ncbi:hypothetical protein WI95_06425 [Burkholderia contaminans]|nr:hypothetical protein WI95_06425 [Burkholderia contaminans]RQS99398.1 hypothetical protein DF035_21750 [Burkholderia contaminans]